jgi:hypothetical protein
MLASESSVGFRLEPKDQLGTYRIEVQLIDRIAGKTVIVADSVEAEASVPKADSGSVS